MIDKDHVLSVKNQCELLGIARSTAYYEPVPVPEADLEAMRAIDEIHVGKPFLGSRRLTDELRKLGIPINRKRLRRLMRLMGIEAIYPKPKTTKPGTGAEHRIYPYLLGDLDIDRANRCWASDITFIPMARGFAYLVAILDVHSRRVLAWRLSNTMDTRFCLEALEEALTRYGPPEVFNTDQGSQFTSQAFTSLLEDNDIRISMDGKGRWRDNIFIERFWWSLKYEEVYLHAYDDLRHARETISTYIDYYNQERQHSSLGKLTPEQAYQKSLAEMPPLQPSPTPASRQPVTAQGSL
jgi:putative transposase